VYRIRKNPMEFSIHVSRFVQNILHKFLCKFAISFGVNEYRLDLDIFF
jgi:hypothetical protein